MNYNSDTQQYFLQFLLSSESTYVRCQNIIDPKYFDSDLSEVVEYILDYSSKSNSVPLVEEINSQLGFKFEKIDGINQQHEDAFLSVFEEFCRHKAIKNVIMSAPTKLDNGSYSELEGEIKDALLISLQTDMGTDYFADPRGRIEQMLAENQQLSTGWRDIDRKLYGGMNRGELTIVAGNSGSGKSLFLQNLALNWSLQGLNVVFLTLELSENLTSMRIDAMITNLSTRDVVKKIDDVELKVKMAAKSHGKIQIKYMSAGSTSNEIKAYINELIIKTGVRPDAICIDYLDLVYPNNSKINPSDMFIKDKFVTEELRSLAAETGMLMASASQLNRCLSPNTIVIANGTPTKLSDVCVGDTLYSDGDDVMVTEVLPIIKQPVFKITTKSGKTIVVSGNHKMQTDTGLKTISGGLKVGDILFTQ